MSDYAGFVGPSYVAESPLASLERLVNWHVRRNETPSAKAQFSLYPTPGLSTLATATGADVEGRGAYALNGRPFFAIGTTLYEMSSAFGLTSRGTLVRDHYPVGMVGNGDGGEQLFVSSGGAGNILDLSTNVYTPNVVAGANMIGMLNGRFLALDFATSTLSISDDLDGTSWDPTNIIQRSDAPDRWRSLLVAPPGFWLFGDETTSIWYDAGTFPIPFAMVTNVRVPEGIAASFSAELMANGPVWLAGSKKGGYKVVQAQGYRPLPVSSHAVDHAINSYDTVSDAVAYSYSVGKQEFYVLNFPSAGATWVWDPALGVMGWHERGLWDSMHARYRAWGPRAHCLAFGKNTVVDARTGAIYDMNANYHTDAGGVALRRLRIAPGLSRERKRIFYDRFGLDIETGVGLPTGQGTNPLVEMRYSDTFGKTWSNALYRSFGRQGEFKTTVEWWDCGSSEKPRAFQVVVSDPVPARITGAYLDVTVVDA